MSPFLFLELSRLFLGTVIHRDRIRSGGQTSSFDLVIATSTTPHVHSCRGIFNCQRNLCYMQNLKMPSPWENHDGTEGMINYQILPSRINFTGGGSSPIFAPSYGTSSTAWYSDFWKKKKITQSTIGLASFTAVTRAKRNALGTNLWHFP